MTNILKSNGEIINRKKVQRLMKIMGLEAMYQRPRTSIGNKEHYKFPHLLKDLEICKPNQVWGTDITYIPTETGYLYLAAILDLFSRYVLSWKLSDNLESNFCVEVLQEALSSGMKPVIFNTDQGAQYTSKAHTRLLQMHGISISMSGKGKCWDNIFVERLWRSLKYEEVYLGSYTDGKEASDGIGRYFNFYNNDRLHQTLNYKTPSMIHYLSNTSH
jgi:putative transposase